jgi:Bacterial extracellular solute-binding proteins, family 3
MNDVARQSKTFQHPGLIVPGVLLWAFLCVSVSPGFAATLEDIKSKGILHCGVDVDAAHFSMRTDAGDWLGFHVDFCRALAAAVLGDAGKLNITGLADVERVEALQSGEIDVLVSRLPVTTRIAVEQGILFAEPVFVDAAEKRSFAPAVRQGDDDWFSIVQAVRHGLVRAELGETPGEVTGLAQGWFQIVLQSVGTYSDMFARNFGASTARGGNAAVEKGGALWAPPFE